MASESIEVNSRGRRTSVSAISVGEGANVVVEGRGLRMGRLHDEFWLPNGSIPSPEAIVRSLLATKRHPDIFTFAERLPAPGRTRDHHVEWESLAVAQFHSYEDWFEKQVNRSVRKHVRKAEREGLVAQEAPFSESLISGIHDIYNEVPVRQGRPFWHYGKNLQQVQDDNASYLERSTFIAATFQGTVVGFLKMVTIEPGVAALMQILSSVAHSEKRPTNALLAKAVEICAARGTEQLVYGHYAYGTKDDSSLIEFKRNNAFNRVDVPRYFVPLTLRGRAGLSLGLHRPWRDKVPSKLRNAISHARAKWHAINPA